MSKDTITDIYGFSCYADTDSVKPPKRGTYSIGYINYFKREWERITGKLRRYPRVMQIPLVPEDRSHEKRLNG